MKNYSTAPLPFQGQKRRFVRSFLKAVENYPNNAVYIDLFGGSGLLSHNVKALHPSARVIYNDFDNYRERLATIPQTNKLLSECRTLLSDYPRGQRIMGEFKNKINKLLTKAAEDGFTDWITLSASLKFSMDYGTKLEDFTNTTLYSRVKMSDYNADGYLEGVEITCCDYKVLFERFKHCEDVVFLVDPPYLSTDSATYNSTEYWKLKDYLDVLKVLTNNNYFYFTSNKSQIVELCDWISSVSTVANPFHNANCTKINTSTTHNSKYIDIMYHYKTARNE